jgi:hypothetical protein
LASIRDPYATVADYRKNIGKIDPEGDLIIRRDLVAISRFLDERLEVAGTGFWCDAADAETSRVYIPRLTGNGYSPMVLDIQPVVSVSSVKVDSDGDGAFDESAVDVANYRLLPLNATSGPAPKPYRKLEVTPWGSQGSWPATLQLKVTGRHGWPAVPEAIVVATIELTRLLRIEGPRATNRLDEGGVPLFLSRDAQARNIISDLIMTFHPTGGVVVA